MTRLLFCLAIVLSLVIGGCPKREQPPKSAYGDDLLESAQRVQEEQKEADAREKELQKQAAAEAEEEYEGECTRQAGGCKQGYICWDSYYCKQGFEDQCSGSGDKMCHRKCVDDNDCPRKMPVCTEKPIFHGTERGVLEKFCVVPADK